ncbi:unnamed protein product [Mytilus edulis]|uniref:DZIP3-like HEPN domain-containing protein n=1 Tax=Mytilus edulis TaxID=6550 RepID=A0A8S3SXF2_MYTED|nr:unnamed protein product [Mytilus edulis]
MHQQKKPQTLTGVCRLLLGPCTDQLRDLLRHHVPTSTFPSVINHHRCKLPRLTLPQKNLILPNTGCYSGNYVDMDISLLYILLRNICGIPPHINGWGYDPVPTDRTTSANIERIRSNRNQCVHSASPTLSTADFNSIWSSVRSTVVEIDKYLRNGNRYEKEVDLLRHETMDPVRDNHYRDELERQTKEDQGTRDKVNELKRKFKLYYI